MINKKYSAQMKMETVEEFVKLRNENPKLTKTEFAVKKGIPDSTFIDWVLKYEREGIGFCNITDEIKKLNEIEIIDAKINPQSIVKKMDDDSASLPNNKVKLQYNGAVIEFDESLLERVLNILKSW